MWSRRHHLQTTARGFNQKTLFFKVHLFSDLSQCQISLLCSNVISLLSISMLTLTMAFISCQICCDGFCWSPCTPSLTRNRVWGPLTQSVALSHVLEIFLFNTHLWSRAMLPSGQFTENVIHIKWSWQKNVHPRCPKRLPTPEILVDPREAWNLTSVDFENTFFIQTMAHACFYSLSRSYVQWKK